MVSFIYSVFSTMIVLALESMLDIPADALDIDYCSYGLLVVALICSFA